MKSKEAVSASRQRTRHAILEAMADVIMESSGIGFSVQAVAGRARVSHRTVYNHFPTREALCEAFSEYVDELLAATGAFPGAPVISLESLPSLARDLYRMLELRDRYARASVMLMLANRRPLKAWRGRTHTMERVIAAGMGARPPLPPRQVAAAARMFVSSVGWHLLTEQIGLSTDEAAATSAWATRTLLDAATRGAHAKRRRRG